MIFNVGAGGATDADKIKYGDSNVGATLDNLNESVGELDKSVGELNESLVASDNLKFQFATDGEGNYGYLGADDSFIPFSNGVSPKLVYSGASISTYTLATNPNEHYCVCFVDNNRSGLKTLSNCDVLINEQVGDYGAITYISFVKAKGTEITITSTKTVASMKIYKLNGKELKALIPSMTSNTTPSGEVSASSYYQNPLQPPYQAVMGTPALWGSLTTDKNGWWQYTFAEKVKPKRFDFTTVSGGAVATKTYKIQLLNDNGEWIDVTDVLSVTTTSTSYLNEYSASVSVMLDEDRTFKTTAIRYQQISTTANNSNLGSVQVYG